jgi:hypothetical protein
MDLHNRDPKHVPEMSLHNLGRAADFNWNAVPEDMQNLVVWLANLSGLQWGGNCFDNFYDPCHLQATNSPTVTPEAVNAAFGIYMSYQIFGITGLSDMELYVLYGVFTEAAAWLVIDNSEQTLIRQ